jgi:glutamine synthetase
VGLKDVDRQKTVLPETSASEKFFGSHVFSSRVMEQMLPKKIRNNILLAREGKETIKVEYADTIALAMKEWALSYGATHFCHWFQPLTGSTAEKHDSFIDWKTSDTVISNFSGSQLIQGEPDASSFPSGGLRSTYEARGYTGWDPSSSVFIWKSGDGAILFIPSVFFSWTGEALDHKIPLLKSDQKINTATLRLLSLTGDPATRVFSTLGWEQEYFVIDRKYYQMRPDLVILGQTVFGAAVPKGQDLQDHYFGSVKNRILTYMKECEDAAIELGIPVKTRHNEVAPAQHELAAVYESASRSVDHNLMMMELMQQIAIKHGLACLMQEKPFAHLNGSGKHNNWSLATDTGMNLLDPTDTPENSIQFLILLTAIVQAVHRHAPILRASIGSFSNDFRLGGHEAPPAIISIYLGETLESLLDSIENSSSFTSLNNGTYNLGLSPMPELPKDNTDRNRTSPFAFTGNKFEFRAPGSSQSCSFPITVINVIVAESLNELLDTIENSLPKQHYSQEKFAEFALPVLKESLKKSKPIRFSGDNYSKEWKNEAKKRQLPNLSNSLEAFKAYQTPNVIQAFKGVLTQKELESRYQICLEKQSTQIDIFATLNRRLFNTSILPATIEYQNKLAKSLCRTTDLKIDLPIQLLELFKEIQTLSNKGIEISLSIEKYQKIKEFTSVLKECAALRIVVDTLEEKIDSSSWPFPAYWEMLFLV